MAGEEPRQEIWRELYVQVGDDYVAIFVPINPPPLSHEVMRFQNILGAYRFFHDGLQAILAKHPEIEREDWDSGPSDLSGR